MNLPLRIFVSSVQKELAAERSALRDYLSGDVLMRRFFDPFLFEDQPAVDIRADQLYLAEVERCDIYLGIFGEEYGFENSEGLSPTHLEFRKATELGKQRLIFVKGQRDGTKHPKMQALIRQAGSELIRRRFESTEDFLEAVYASLVKILEDLELVRLGPFDAAACRNATLNDLDPERVHKFLGLARRGRSFPLAEDTSAKRILTHLDLLAGDHPSHAAILLFGRKPQRFLPASEVKCAHFHGFEIQKPIPSYQVYKGTLFEMVDQAKDFVLSKIDLWVGTRAESVQAPTAYEIPQEVVSEAIVNAVVHRDYTSKMSVQVMLFKDRLEIWNPGSLPPSLTIESLKGPHPSVPANPLIAEPMYLTKYIERMGTGILDMIRRCREAGLREPEIRIDHDVWITTIWRKNAAGAQSTDPVNRPSRPTQSTDPVLKVVQLLAIEGELGPSEIQERLGLKHRPTFRENYLRPAMDKGMIERTIPDKPNSRLQKYRLTDMGRTLLKEKR